MDDKKVVSLEDRIPKLKEARRKKTNRRLVYYLCLFFFLIAIVVYLQSPLSYIKSVHVTGHQYLTEEIIIEQAELLDNVNIWGIRLSDVEARINELPEIEQVHVQRNLPNGIEITVEELNKVAYVNRGEVYFPLLENGHMLEFVHIDDYQGDAPLLFNFTDEEYLTLLTDELVSLPDVIASHISEIHWAPTESNPFTLELYMNDGVKVLIGIRNFTERMNSYPSIVSQLDGESGVIEMGVGGAIFYTNEETVNDEVDQGDAPTAESDE